MSESRRVLVLPLFLWVVVLAVACGSSDPFERTLEQRARWNVTLLSWSESTDGSLIMSVRLSGPPSSSLEALTVRVVLTDDAGDVVHRFWHTFDLSDIERGGPADRSIRARDVPAGIAGAGIDPVLRPDPEDIDHIVELRGLPSN